MKRQRFFEGCRYSWIPCASIMVLAVLAYGNSFPGAFILDDVTLVRDNPLVAEFRFWSILTSDYWGVYENSGLYRPLTILSFVANRLLLGADAWGFHLVNVLLHALVAWLVYLVTRSWFGERRVAWLAAALFAVHPIHTEVVNEVVGRGELLVAVFGLSALWLARRPGPVSAFLSLLGFVAALFSKEHAVVLLIMLPTVDWCLSERHRLCRHWTYYLALTLSAFAWLAVRSWGVTRQVPSYPEDPFFMPLAFVEPWVRMTTALKLQWQMLGKLLFPAGLQGIYSAAEPFSILLEPLSLAGVTVIFVTLVLLAVVGRGMLRREKLAMLAVCYLFAVLPTSNFFFATGVTFAERLAYFPSIWFCAAAAVVITGAGQRWKGFPVPAVAGIAVISLLTVTLIRNPDFSDPVKLWRHDVEASPDNVIALKYLAYSLSESGRIQEADRTYRQMVALAPEFPEGLRAYAETLLQLGRPLEAVPLLEQAVQSGAENSTLSCLLLAEAHYKLGNFDEALQSIDRAGQFYQHYWYYWALRGMVLEGNKRQSEAVDSYFKARPWPPNSDLAQRAGLLLLGMGRTSEAEPVLREAVAGAGSAAAWNGLGVVLALQDKSVEALQAFNTAVKLEPSSLRYQENLQRMKLSAEGKVL